MFGLRLLTNAACLLACVTVSALFPLQSRTENFFASRQSSQPAQYPASNAPPPVRVIGPDQPRMEPNEPWAVLAVQKWLVKNKTCEVGEWGLRAAGEGSPLERLQEELSTLHKGSIAVSGPRTEAPDGFVRRVVSVNSSDGRKTYCTVQASLADAIPGKTLKVEVMLPYGEIASVSSQASGVTVSPLPGQLTDVRKLRMDEGDPPAAVGACVGAYAGFATEFERTSVQAGMAASGNIELCPKLLLEIHYGFLRIEQARLMLTLAEQSEIDVSAHAIGHLAARRDIARIRFRPLVVMVGSVPVVLRPVVTIFVSAEGSLQSNLTGRLLQGASAAGELNYRRGRWDPPQPITVANNPSPQFSYSPVSMRENVKASLGADIELEVYGTIGPFLEPSLFVQAEHSSRAGCSLTSGIEGSAGINLLAFGHTLSTKNFGDFFSHELGQKPCP